MPFGLRLRPNHRRAGNRHRDRLEWSEAAAAYRRHLRRHPGDGAIQVQLGHALKEQGRLEEAVNAYSAAKHFPDQEADALTHLAHLLLRLDRPDQALAAFYRLHAMTDDPDVWQQITRLRRRPDAAPTLEIGGDAVFFTIQDLFIYLRAHSTMSGIQRVQAGIAAHAIADPSIDARFILNQISEEAYTLSAGEFWLLDNARLAAIVAYASGAVVDHGTLQMMLDRCEEAAVRVRPTIGSTIVVLGAFWAVDNSVEQLVHSRREGVRIAAYIYDLIPITHPEYCDTHLVVDFTTAFCEICFIADFLLTISDATRVAVESFLASHGGRPIPVRTVPLAHLMTGDVAAQPVWPRSLARLKGRPYVAYVSTVEGRKNHVYVLNAWRQLIAEGVQVPDLIFVGRMGWRIAGLKELLDATDDLGGRVHIVHGLTDGELNAIYAGCLFTVFTSFVEGWGLPVGEALIHHRPAVVSNTSSIPEVGGEFVDYVDPYNLHEGVAAFRRMILDTTYRRGREAAIRDRFTPRDWKAVARDFVAEVDSMRREPAPPAANLRIPPAVAFWLGTLLSKPKDLDAYLALPYRLLVGSGSFYRAEEHGAWMRGRDGSFDLFTPFAPGTAVLIYLKLAVAPWALGTRVIVAATASDGPESGSFATSQVSVDGASLSVRDGLRLNGQVGENGLVTVTFTVFGDYAVPPGDPRDFAIGLRAIGYAPANDTAARQQLMESFTFPHVAG